MTIAGISQPTWKWTPSLWISDHWLMTVRTRKPKMRTASPIWRARRTARLRGGLRPEPRPGLADPVQEWLAALHVRRTLVTSTAPPDRLSRATGQFGIVEPMGEFELLAKLRERLPPAGPRVRLGSGDDAAVTVPGGATATSVDAIVDGVHFRRGEADARA